MKIDFFLPVLPVSTNNLYGTTRGGMRYKKPDVVAFERTAVLMLPKRVKMVEHCFLYVEFRACDRRTWSRRDTDNMLKLLQDCMQLAGMLKNDSLILHIEAKKILSDRESIKGYLESVDVNDFIEVE